MPVLNKDQRNTVKAVLDAVMDDYELKRQFNVASALSFGAISSRIVSDAEMREQGQYASILKEIIDERTLRSHTPFDASTPSLEVIKKKYNPKR